MSDYTVCASPLGPLFVGASEAGVHRIDFLREPGDEAACLARLEAETGEAARRDGPTSAAAAQQLGEYFAGARATFDLPLAAHGTPFQQAVWHALSTIGYGETTTYAAIAATIGHEGAARAAGGAIGRNPLAIVVPCHRVVGTGGALTGYASGLDRKRWLLSHEAAQPLPAAPAARQAAGARG